MSLFFTLIIVIEAIAICTLFAIGIERSLAIVCSGLVLITFFCGVMGKLNISLVLLYSIVIITVVCAVVTFIIRKKRTSNYIVKWFTPGLAFFCINSILAFFYCRQFVWCYYDEFSHWGTVVKDIFIHSNLCDDNANDLFLNYPPGMALFEWLILRFNNVFDESMVYYAYDLFGLSFLSVMFENETFRKNRVLPIIAKEIVAIIVPFLFFYHMWSNLQVDALLGVLVFFLYQVLLKRYEGNSNFDEIVVSLGMCMLVLIKDSGLAIAVCIVICSLLCSFKLKNSNKKELISHGIYILPAILVKTIWSCFWKSKGTAEVTIQNIFSDYRGREYYTDILREYCKTIFRPFISISIIQINFILVILLLIIVCIGVMIEVGKEKRRNLKLLICSLFAIFVFYSAGILYMYMTTLPYEAAIEIPAFKRYEGTILLGFVLFLAVQFIDNLNNKYKTLVIPFIVACLLVCSKPAFQSYLDHIAIQECRDTYDSLERYTFSAEDRVFVVTQHESMAYYVANYLLAPIKVQDVYSGTFNEFPQYMYSLREAEDGEAAYAAWDITCSTWEKYLYDNGFTHVYLYNIDDHFRNTYCALFADEIEEQRIYMIDKRDGRIQIKYVSE